MHDNKEKNSNINSQANNSKFMQAKVIYMYISHEKMVLLIKFS